MPIVGWVKTHATTALRWRVQLSQSRLSRKSPRMGSNLINGIGDPFGTLFTHQVIVVQRFQTESASKYAVEMKLNFVTQDRADFLGPVSKFF
jgi:hypothetical protein